MRAVKKGQIQLGNEVIVSDPCYDMNVWCAKTIDNVLSGVYNVYVKRQDDDRVVTELSVCHKDFKYNSNYSGLEIETYVCVDSGTCGIYDLEYYEEHHYDNSIDEEWYGKNVCNSRFWEKPMQSSILDGKGVISCSGYGDGSYHVFVRRTNTGEVYQITIVYAL